MTRPSNGFLRFSGIELFWWALCVLCAAAHAFASRHYLNPDGMSYLDVATRSIQNGSSNLIHAYWSPGYPTLISVLFRLSQPTAAQEVPAIHVLNFLIFLAALCAFRRLLETTMPELGDCESSRSRWQVSFGYSLFLWASLALTGVDGVTPDLSVMAIVLWAGSVTNKIITAASSKWDHIRLGVILGAGYYFKAVMLPLGIGLLIVLLISSRRVTARVRGLAFSIGAFGISVLPLIIGLSHQQGRFSTGEVGRLAYAWYVNGHLWAEDVDNPRSNESVHHPAPKLTYQPITLVFDESFAGTYPVWYDASKWYPDLEAVFSFKQQAKALERTSSNYLDFIRLASPFLAGGIALFALSLLSSRQSVFSKSSSTALAWAILFFVVYALVHVEMRFLSGAAVLACLAIYHELAFRTFDRQRMCIVATIMATICVPQIWLAGARGVLALEQVREGHRPDYATAAEWMGSIGIGPGNKIATVGYSFDTYYARYGRFRVHAQIPSAKEFWALGGDQFKTLMATLSATGIRAVVTRNPPRGCEGEGWRRTRVSPSLEYCVYVIER